jgi:hypothetical protein
MDRVRRVGCRNRIPKPPIDAGKIAQHHALGSHQSTGTWKNPKHPPRGITQAGEWAGGTESGSFLDAKSEKGSVLKVQQKERSWYFEDLRPNKPNRKEDRAKSLEIKELMDADVDVMRTLMKAALQEVLEAEMSETLGRGRAYAVRSARAIGAGTTRASW